jgi:hypothetical protein
VLADDGNPFDFVITKALWAKSEEMLGERF